MTISELEKKARQIRRDTLVSIHAAKSGHTGGSLSETDLLVGVYFGKMRVNPNDPQWEDRDRFVLSKAHANPALYAILADLGFFPKEDLLTLRKLHSNLQGHPNRKKTPGLDTSSGSLGQGLSIAVGMAIGARLKSRDCQVYCIIGDGETQEGQIWEASMAAAHYRLDNLTAIWDCNQMQIDGRTNDVMSLGDLEAKLRSFGYHVVPIDGNDMAQVMMALNVVSDGKPKAILANTVKSKGVSFMEDKVEWHGKAPNDQELAMALSELGD